MLLSLKWVYGYTICYVDSSCVYTMQRVTQKLIFYKITKAEVMNYNWQLFSQGLYALIRISIHFRMTMYFSSTVGQLCTWFKLHILQDRRNVNYRKALSAPGSPNVLEV